MTTVTLRRENPVDRDYDVLIAGGGPGHAADHASHADFVAYRN